MGKPLADVVLEALRALAVAARAVLEAPPHSAKSARAALECQTRAARRMLRYTPDGPVHDVFAALEMAGREVARHDFASVIEGLREAVRRADEVIDLERHGAFFP